MPRSSDHPAPSSLRAYLLGDEREDQRSEIEGHLLPGCLACVLTVRREQERLQAERGGRLRSGQGGAAEALRRRTEAARKTSLLIDSERLVARELVEGLLLLAPEARRAEARSDRRYRLYAVAELLVERAREEAFRDVLQAVELAELAVEVAEAVPPELYGRGPVYDLHALAWGALGNAHRVRGDLSAAGRALDTALRLGRAKAATGDPLQRAELLSLLGSLRIDQARFGEAAQSLEKAVRTYRDASQRRLEGKTLVQLAKAAGESGQCSRAAELLERAETLLDPEADSQIFFFAAHARSAWLNQAGRIDEAAALFEEMLPIWERKLEGFAPRQRVRWLSAAIARSRGELERAEEELDAVRHAFGGRGEAYPFALVTLDLAALYLDQGRTREVRRLAEEMLPIFASHQVHHHALAALVLFQQAALTETVTASFVGEVATYLRRARANPDLPFRPSEAAVPAPPEPRSGG